LRSNVAVPAAAFTVTAAASAIWLGAVSRTEPGPLIRSGPGTAAAPPVLPSSSSPSFTVVVPE
jgi:hypothetical protein